MSRNHAGGGHPDNELHLDSCICDIKTSASEMISDADLPPAAGGVHLLAVSPGDSDEDVCGFQVTDATADEDLPATTGGVA